MRIKLSAIEERIELSPETLMHPSGTICPEEEAEYLTTWMDLALATHLGQSQHLLQLGTNIEGHYKLLHGPTGRTLYVSLEDLDENQDPYIIHYVEDCTPLMAVVHGSEFARAFVEQLQEDGVSTPDNWLQSVVHGPTGKVVLEDVYWNAL